MTQEVSYVGDSPELVGTVGIAGKLPDFEDRDSINYLSFWYQPVDSEDCFYVDGSELADGHQ